MSDDERYESMDDDELIDSAHDGDPDAVGELLRRECAKSRSLASRLEVATRPTGTPGAERK